MRGLSRGSIVADLVLDARMGCLSVVALSVWSPQLWLNLIVIHMNC